MAPAPEKLTWVDHDGDRFTLYDEGTHGSLAVIQIVDSETGVDNEVYVQEQDAREIVKWLLERLGRV